MSDRPEAVSKLEALLAAGLIAHETIHDLHRELLRIEAEGATELLRESARIATDEIPTIASAAQQLIARFTEESVVDPHAAAQTINELGVELDRVEPRLRALVSRQVEIARELRALLRQASG